MEILPIQRRALEIESNHPAIVQGELDVSALLGDTVTGFPQ
jgi:hypothetical protein